MLSTWPTGCLRATPRFLWSASVHELKAQLPPALSDSTFQEVVLQSATEIRADARHRWTIPVELALRAHLEAASERITFVACEVWIELWSTSVREQRMTMSLHSFAGRSLNSPVVPRPPSRSQ